MAKAKASAITLSPQQEELLNQLCRRRSSAQQQVKRAKIILASANGASNSEIARRLSYDRITVRLWRERWLASSSSLTEVAQSAKDKDLLRSMEAVLSDAYRSGTPATFSSEQVVQIIALACEAPKLSNRPLSHWTARELADEAVKRGLVDSISPQTVARFLKGNGNKAASVPLLAD